ncbi:MAG: DUF1816 domain-containing protein, partial [Cyanobacteria bacterium J06607_10]
MAAIDLVLFLSDCLLSSHFAVAVALWYSAASSFLRLNLTFSLGLASKVTQAFNNEVRFWILSKPSAFAFSLLKLFANTVMKNFFSGLFGFFSNPWWVKITTAEPNCIYYFGPFDDESEALQAKPGFVEDLQMEGASQIQTVLQNISQPKELTIEITDPV